jgi:cytochrome c
VNHIKFDHYEDIHMKVELIKQCLAIFASVTLFTLSISAPVSVFGMDANNAQTLLKDSKCFKCHAAEKKKDGPAYRDVAAKFRGDPEAEKKLIHHMTNGDKVKFADGHEEDHKKVKTSDMTEIKNLVQWIQSLEGGTKY